MVKYEALYVLKPDMEDEKKDALVKKFADIVTADGGAIAQIDEWGKKRLAYPIQYINDGYYVLMTFEAKPTLPMELERNFKISDDVLRFMVISLDQK